MSPRRFSSSQRSGSMPVSRTISEDLPWSTWPAVATTRGPIARRGAHRASVVLDELVALDRVQDRAREVGDLLVGHGPHVEQHVVVGHAAEHRRGLPDREPSRRTPADRAPSRGPPTTAIGRPGRGATADHRLAPMDVGVLEVAAERLGQSLRALVHRRRDGSRNIRCTGTSSSWPRAYIARTCSSAATCILSTRTARATGCARSLAIRSARADDAARPAVRRAACRRRTSPGRRRRRGRRPPPARPAGIPWLVCEQARADVVEERDAVAAGEGRQVLGGGRGREPDHPVVRGMHLEDRRPAIGRRAPVVGEAGAVRRADLHELGAGRAP